MTSWAGERVVDLQSRGFKNAGLYDPPGVGGAHVMYVLHHTDQPSRYGGLPDRPRISLFVEAWTWIPKPLALAGIAFTALACSSGSAAGLATFGPRFSVQTSGVTRR
jgi:formate dehydrogenase iron-sulfur subunit